ncbi:hypothetical protein [Rubripirellula reticaptiva]|uniref:Uncharacterized protein n=1 Tax=Rubripirellula reticaptiva TaxID=2528013 RepID=A0A5C6F420_9BACT|nr:hypothetical protein [Rubripirellula reticaptiva]TWU55852.1 hypothetical protein Poly59_21550 [Rubripirellula reticaptiva]
MKAELHKAAKATSEDRLSFIKFKPVFGDLATNDRFTTMYAKMAEHVYSNPDVRDHMREIAAFTTTE